MAQLFSHFGLIRGPAHFVAVLLLWEYLSSASARFFCNSVSLVLLPGDLRSATATSSAPLATLFLTSRSK
ncbi:hypothetical protein CRG98_016927, partial [Punica granatum]